MLVGSVDNGYGLSGNIQAVVDHKKEDEIFFFLMIYSSMARHFLPFIEASRIRIWEQHLDAVEDLIPDLAAMNRLKYRIMLPVYIPGMCHSKEHVLVQNALEKDFSCQSPIFLALLLAEITVESRRIDD